MGKRRRILAARAASKTVESTSEQRKKPNPKRKDLGRGQKLGKRKRRAAAARTDPETAELASRHLKKLKTSQYQLAESPGGELRANSGLSNPLANADQNLETPLSLENVEKKRKKSKKKRKTSHSQLAESPGGESKANIGLNSQLANENLKLEPPLPVENVEKKINKSRITKNSVNREIFKQQLKKGALIYFKGGLLDELLEKVSRAIEAAEQVKGQVNDNIWMKQKFSVGVNDVTRTLERMPIAKAIRNITPDIKHPKLVPETFDHLTTSEDGDAGPNKQSCSSLKPTGKQVVILQAVLTAIDCHPRLLVSHLPGLASSRDVPLICIEDHGRGSLRLGQLLKLKRAGAIGVKVGQSTINKAIQDIIDHQSTGCNDKVAVKAKDIALD